MNSYSYKLVARIPTLNFAQTFELSKGRRYLLGSAAMEPGMLVFTRDRSLSRRQAWLEVTGDVLVVERHPRASQALNADDQTKSLRLQNGEAFTAGATVFEFVALTDEHLALPGKHWEEEKEQGGIGPGSTFTLTARDFSWATRENSVRSFLEVVMEMPALMQTNNAPADFLLALCRALQSHVTGLRITAWRVEGDTGAPELLALHQAPAGEEPELELVPIRPSRHLVKQALEAEDYTSVVSVWSRDQATHDPHLSLLSSGAAWAMCIPLKLSERERFAFYATGKQLLPGTDPREIQQILAALGAMATQHLLAVRMRERRAQIGQFFSPALRTIMLGDSTHVEEALKPVEQEATICFFDLRGSSREAEDSQSQSNRKSQVGEYFARLECILGEATNVVFQTGGIVIDFQGDAIMACWGVPHQQTPTASVSQAIIAGRRIVELMIEHAWPQGDASLRCGLGITSGKVLAGVFTAQATGQALLSKYTVMGPPVNQAARLESLTKKLAVPILVDGSAAAALSAENILLRRIAAVRPAGMGQIVQVYELVLPRELGGTGVTESGARSYESALRAFESGDFEAATAAMRAVPDDQIKLFLSEYLGGMKHQGTPSEWDGVIHLASK
ncbi:MAG: adenylate/guanylate cyclase domain-containing protein [bacterium]